jgi:ABC-type ATPase with predicted acetyltransferase domain
MVARLGYVWHTKTGKSVYTKEISEEYIHNIIAFIKEGMKFGPRSYVSVSDYRWIEILEAELQVRENLKNKPQFYEIF